MPTAKKADFDALFEKIRGLGFPLVGAVDLSLAREAFEPHREHYRKWIEAGYQGDMAYLERGLERRFDPLLVFPNTKSILSCAIPYRRNPTKCEAGAPGYARYLEGPDYHLELPKRLGIALQAWAAEFKNSLEAEGISGVSLPTWKICVDTSAVLERTWAALCGLGWIGKNTLLIHPQLGSYFFIATVFIDVPSDRAPKLIKNYCGNCERCISSCPTGAIVSANKLDARKCIAYLTLEKRGEWNLPESLASKTQNWIAGCDICQEVCPYNIKPARLPETWPQDPRDEVLIREWNRLSDETEEDYRKRVKFSALSRIKYPEMRRNIARARKNLEDLAQFERGDR